MSAISRLVLIFLSQAVHFCVSGVWLSYLETLRWTPVVCNHLWGLRFDNYRSTLNCIDIKTHASNPRSSHMVSHPSTVWTKCYLSSVFEWELVLLLWLNSILVYSTWQGHFWLPISCKILQHFEIRGFMLNNDWGMNEENKVRKIGSPEILTGIWKHF